MKVLLIGEYSDVQRTLRDTLRRAGHEATLVSDGDGWKNYGRDVDLRRRWHGPAGSLPYVAQLAWQMRRWRGYDVVHIVNPKFLDLRPRWCRWVYDYLRRHNCVMSVGCYGDDYEVVSQMQTDDLLLYTDFRTGGHAIDTPENERRRQTWLSTERRNLCRHVMEHADCLIACLYEYYKVYETTPHAGRLHYIALPVEHTADRPVRTSAEAPVRVLVGVQRTRAAQKGTAAVERLLARIEHGHEGRIAVTRVENVPYATYRQLLAQADVVVDQLYSYSPAMNALAAMSLGAVVVSGGEEDYYAFIGEDKLRPIVNLRPNADADNLAALRNVLLDPRRVMQMQREGIDFVRKHHDADDVAARYVDVWTKAMQTAAAARGAS